MQDLTDLYQSVILDHNRRPRNRGKLPTANRVAHGDNPSCGDQCTVYLRLDGDRIGDISFEGSGCAISQASASLMTTQVKGKTAAEVQALYDELLGEPLSERSHHLLHRRYAVRSEVWGPALQACADGDSEPSGIAGGDTSP
jgi:SUF system NifU family Fe-S assembly protein